MNDKNAAGTLRSLVAVLVPSVVACAVVARTLAYYLGRDPMAGFIVALMGVGLLVGVFELVVRTRRAGALRNELRRLPDAPSEADVERASPTLRAMLRARLEHSPMPLAGESLTGYLVGLMVMLGLLGTLLGLFETLGGAGRALTASTNVDALRSGLSGPMLGLTRSFGCSAAGVAASAMLGLASLLVRRNENGLVQAVHRYAGGALRALSPVRRQLAALESLAAQGAAMPDAAKALAAVGLRVEQLTERWEATQMRASEVQASALRGAFGDLRGDMEGAARAMGKALEGQLTAVLTGSVASTERLAREHLSSVRASLDQELSARRKGDDEASARASRGLTDLAQQLASEMRSHGEQVRTGFSGMFEALSARDAEHKGALVAEREEARAHVAALGDAARALVTQLDDEARARREEASRLLGELAEKLDAASRERAAQSRDELTAITGLGERLAKDVDARERTRSAAWTELAERVEQMAQATRSEEEARLARLDSLAGRIGVDLGKLSDAVAKQLETRMDAEAALSARSHEVMTLIERSAAALDTSLTAQKAALDTLLEESAQQMSTLGVKAQEGANAALLHLMEVADAQAERFSALSSTLGTAHSEQARALSGELTGHAERLGKGLEGTSELVHEAAALLKASSVEMGAVTEMFAKSVERQREAAKTWLESLGELEGAIERVGRGAAADALGDHLASTQEVFARQLQFQRELFEQLRSLRTSHAPSRGEHDVSA